MPVATRRTQADRTATTRAALLDATIDCIVERGWSGTTTTEIAQRAGVSRGAQLHHFPTKGELVVAAVEHLYARRVEDFRSAMATVPAGPGRLEAAIDVLWGFVQGPTFVAWIELQLAARTDDALRETLLAAELRTRDWTTAAFTEPTSVRMAPGASAGPIVSASWR